MGKNFCNVGHKWCKLAKRGVCLVSNADIETMAKCPRIAQIETRTLKDVLRESDFESAFTELLKSFPNEERSREKYKEVYHKLLKLKPRKTHNLSDLFIDVDNEDGYFDVYGRHPCGNSNVRYGLEFCPWRDWVSMFITQSTLDKFTPNEIVGACLYEMTFDGFSNQQVQAARDRLIKNFEELKEQVKNGKK